MHCIRRLKNCLHANTSPMCLYSPEYSGHVASTDIHRSICSYHLFCILVYAQTLHGWQDTCTIRLLQVGVNVRYDDCLALYMWAHIALDVTVPISSSRVTS